ncbi:MAG: hypothetical protein LAO55_26455 [Acidobacteriia bacterium]|nr:hypothetical protein [Terriglobia bacterium]
MSRACAPAECHPARTELALAGLKVGLGLRLELLHVVAGAGHLPRDSLDQPTVGFETLAALFELFDRGVMFVLHLGDGVGLPEDVGDLVHLRAKRTPELSQNQGELLPDDLFYYYEGWAEVVPGVRNQLQWKRLGQFA